LDKYAHGIFHERKTATTNHAVLLVGYDTDPETNEDYWIIKNSWGIDWADDHGFFKLARNKKRNAGITDGEDSEAHWVTLS